MAKSKENKLFGPIVHDADVSTPRITFLFQENIFHLHYCRDFIKRLDKSLCPIVHLLW